MLFAFGVVVAAHSQTATSDVFQADMFIRGVITWEHGTNGVIHGVQITGTDLVNLALGRKLGTNLKMNEMLAYGVSPATNNAKLFVYDSKTASNLATIGEINPLVEAQQSGVRFSKTETIARLILPGAGTFTNGLTGGDMTMDARSVLDSNGAVMAFYAKMLGYLHAVFDVSITNFSATNVIVISGKTIETNSVILTNYFIGPTNIPVIIRAATVNTQGGKIGRLIEGP